MRHYFFFTGIILLVVLGCIFCIERMDLLNLKQIDVTAHVQETDGNATLVWERLPYPCLPR